ncbi:MAG TPA: hypothetical protein VFZ49_04120 [Pyrinomonadaceae bacterium]
MIRRIAYIFIILLAASFAAHAQTASNDPWPFPDRDRRRDDDSEFVRRMLSKQQTEREKKEFAELLEKGEAALKLSEQLESSFENSKKLSATDLERLDKYENLVKKIRDDLGGEDDEASALTLDGPAPRNRRDALKTLRRSTGWLVEEIKKSTRFSVSIAAIEGSNALIRLARFLRIKT